ncbi:MAG: hypothetical protein U9Q62_07510 [Campylobacterota bacterium]|nr:hypothetical protein [Campylobacterota bacterium]
MQKHEALETKHYFTPDEIQAKLAGVEYIIMAAPSPDHFKETPIHFTIFLNTHEALPEEIKGAVFEKFCEQYNIINTAHVMSALQAVAFAETRQETPMPMHLVKPEDQRTIPHVPLHVIDFLGDSSDFEQTKRDSLTGWSYSYN